MRDAGIVGALVAFAVLAASGGAGASRTALRAVGGAHIQAPAPAPTQEPGATAASPAPLPDPAFVPDTLAYLQRIEKLGFSGVVAAEGRHGRLIAEGFGLADREKGARWQPTTVSTIGSITKQFTAALVLRLEEEGLLSVQDPIGRHLDGVPADKQGVTLHNLLTHTSGIEDLEGAGDWDPIGREEFVRRALAAPLSAPLGERYSYSNAGYSLLGAIVERRTGHS